MKIIKFININYEFDKRGGGMELKHGAVAAEKRKRMPRNAFIGAAIMAAGIAYFGTMHLAARNNTARGGVAAAVQRTENSCDSVFTDEAKTRIGGVVERAISSKAQNLRDSMGVNGTRTFVNVSVGIDRGGRPVIEDIWAYPEPARNVDAGELIRSSGLRFDGIRLSAPRDGTRCSYTVPVDI
jgi:hypothetical protein